LASRFYFGVKIIANNQLCTYYRDLIGELISRSHSQCFFLIKCNLFLELIVFRPMNIYFFNTQCCVLLLLVTIMTFINKFCPQVFYIFLSKFHPGQDVWIMQFHRLFFRFHLLHADNTNVQEKSTIFRQIPYSTSTTIHSTDIMNKKGQSIIPLLHGCNNNYIYQFNTSKRSDFNKVWFNVKFYFLIFQY